MGCAMMIGVAQVIGTKPMFRSVFSGGPRLSRIAALAASMGKTDARAAAIVEPPIMPMNERRPMSLYQKTDRMIALSTARSIMPSEVERSAWSVASDAETLQLWQVQSAPCRRSVLDENGFPSDLIVIACSICI